MKIKKINKTHIVAAMVLSVAFLFGGCGTDATGDVQTQPDVVEEEILNDKGVAKGDDIKEEGRDKDVENENEITEEEYNANIQSYEAALTEVLDWIQIQ